LHLSLHLSLLGRLLGQVRRLRGGRSLLLLARP
jgi:hypothetical protein